MKRYVDTAVLVSFFVSEVHTEYVRRTIRREGVDNLISEWCITEFHAALSLKLRTGQIDAGLKDEAERLFAKGRQALFRMVPVARLHFRRAADLAAQPALQLRAGDALHLAIAEDVSDRLWTLDRRLLLAAELRGLGTEPL